MDKLKTRVLFISLIILALVSISAVAAADADEVISADQNDFDLSEETIANVNLADDGTGDDDAVNEDGSSVYTINAHMVVNNTTAVGPIVKSNQRTVSSGTTSSLNERTLNVSYSGILNNLKFSYDGYHYVFTHWTDEDGVTLDKNYRKTMIADGKNHTINFYANYDKELIGNHTLKYIDEFGHGSGSETHIGQYGVSYTHTFKEPADIPSGAKFLYWERNDTKEQFNPGDKYSGPYSDIAGQNVVVIVYAVYDLETQIELEEITGYVGDTVDITATITDKVKNKPVPGGTATLTVDFTERLSNGKLMASTYTDTVDVDADGKAVFKNVKLEDPGTYKYTVEYSGYSYNHHDEGINDYLASEADSKLNILPLNTTTSSEDVSGTVGDKKDITADIVDQNGDPVKNGTAVLKVNGKEYTAEVQDGKAVFKGVELTENTTATIEYLGNDYYNPSNTTIQITVTAPPEEPEEPEEPADEPATPAAEKAIPVTPAAGNPIALVVLALLTLVSTVSLGRK